MNFDEYADEVVTLEEVIGEIRDRETRQRLKANPLDIMYKYPDDASVQKILDFARKTGDYGSLSLTGMLTQYRSYIFVIYTTSYNNSKFC